MTDLEIIESSAIFIQQETIAYYAAEDILDAATRMSDEIERLKKELVLEREIVRCGECIRRNTLNCNMIEYTMNGS